MKKIIIGIALLITSMSSFAAVISLIPVGSVKHTAQSGTPALLHYEFKVRNNTGAPMYLNTTHATGMLPNMKLDNAKTTCQFYVTSGGSLTPIPPKGSCVLAYTSNVPTLPDGVKEKTILDTVSVKTETGYSAHYSGVGVITRNLGSRGHLGFDPKPLGLKAKDSGTVTIENTGNKTITATGSNIVKIPTQLATDGFSTTCTKTLDPGDTCDINYTIVDNPTAGSSDISFDGDADNNTAKLNVTISTVGHLGFDPKPLDLKAKDSGTVTIENTGNKTITATGSNIIKIPTQLATDGFSTTCTKTLDPGDTCDINYTIVDNPTAGSSDISFDADADNNTAKLNVTISTVGHLGFDPKPLDLKAKDSGTVTIENTGNKTITATGSNIIKIPTQLATDGFSTTCTKTLDPGDTCDINYTIVDNPTAGSSDISFDADADNNTAKLNVTISTVGHLGFDPTPLDLKAKDSGTVTIENTGNKTITATGSNIIKIPTQLATDGFSTTCTKTLDPGDTCDINYTIVDNPTAGSSDISFDADADNNTAKLNVTISTVGHLGFDPTPLDLKAKDSGTVTIENTGNKTITATGSNIIKIPTQLATDGFSTTCTKTLDPGDTCDINYTIVDNPTAGSSDISFDADADNNTAKLNVTISTVGHLGFDPTPLDLKAKDSGTVTIENTGNKTITATGSNIIKIPTQLATDGFSTTCTKTLDPGDTCDINYTIVDNPTAGSSDISFDADADNNTAKLNVTISTVGHLGFDPKPLDLKAKDSGTVTIENTGNKTITATGSNIIKIPTQLATDGFSTTCTKTLDPGDTCDINYTIVDNPTAGSSDISFDADADNNTAKLNVTISTVGHLGFDPTPLDLKAKDSGTVTIENTGNKTITATGSNIIKIPTQLATDGFSTTCTKTLDPGDTCDINYTIVDNPTAGSSDISFDADADNNTAKLNVTISTVGHLGFDPTPLDLKAKDSGTVTIENTGNKTITATGSNIIKIPTQLATDGFSTTCTKTLDPGDTCDINYTIVDNPTAGSSDISFDADADNNTAKLNVTISTVGHLGFDPTPLDLKAMDSGTVTIENTGNKTITATGSNIIKIPTQLATDGFSTTCTKTLDPGDTCDINYTIVDNPTAGSSDISFDADADNNTAKLNVTIN